MEESTLFPSFELHPPNLNEANVSAILQIDVLAIICGQLESLSTAKNAVMLKHEKNQTVLALSRVCRSWYHQITCCKNLFSDIAFDVSSEESIVTAGVFLKTLEGTTVPISVRAFLGRSSSLDPMLVKLFTRLRPHIQHISHFEYYGDMAKYRPYLDLPAPELLLFSDCFDTYPGRGPPLFCGQMPRLREFTTLSPASQIVWVTSTLSDLTILNLGFLDMEPCVPFSSFLDLLRGSPRLESVNVQCFVPVINPAEDLQDVLLPHLHTLDLQHNEFHTIVKHLRIPNVRKLYFCGESHPVTGVGLNPTFEAPHIFAGLPVLPIFKQPIKMVLSQTKGSGRTEAGFCLHLAADGGFDLRVSLFWVLDAVPLFNDYVERSIAGLVEMMTLAPRARVELSHNLLVPSDVPVYQPFLLVTNIERLTIRGGFSTEVLSKLTTHAGSQHLLPRLRVLNIMDWDPFPNEGDRTVLLSCLRSRVVGGAPLSVRLIDAEACADLSEPEYDVKQDADDCNFVVIVFDPSSARSSV